MNAIRFTLLSMVVLLPMRLMADIQPGSKAEDVYSELGAPRGQAAVGERQLLYYDRGEVELQDGVVTRVAFLSDKELANREAHRAEIAERLEASNAEGEAIKAQKVADLTFQKAPPSVQLAFWQDFARRYPGVSCVEQLAVVRELVRTQTEQERIRHDQERLIADMDARRANEPQVYGIDPYYSGYGYGYGYGRRGNGGRRGGGANYPDVDSGRLPIDRSVGPYSYAKQAVVEPFSPTPIVTPFLPSPPPQVYYPWANLPTPGADRGSGDNGPSQWRDRR